MATEILMPQMGLTQTTGTLLRWYKREGDPVRSGEAICEIETDKATADVETPADGVLGRILITEGTSVPIGHRIAWIVVPGETVPDTAAGFGPETAAPSSKVVTVLPAVSTPTSEPAPEAGAPPARGGTQPPASPAARRVAQELGIDLTKVVGTGPGGRIQEEDVRRARTSQPAVTGIGGRRRTLTKIRQTTARRLAESFQTAPHFYLRVTVDASALAEAKDRLTESGVTYTDLLVRATALVLARHAALNARWDDGAVWEYDRVNVGLAVQTERGLLVPVLHDVSALSLSDIAQRRRDIVERAHAGKLAPEDLEGATFTLTNLGMYNVEAAWPVINPPQAFILAVGAIAPRVIPIEGIPAVRPTVDLVLAVDHRVVDGAVAAQFLADLRGALEDSRPLLGQ